MNRRLCLIYLILGTLGVFSLTLSHAYADSLVSFDDTYQGTGNFGLMSSQSWLEWTITSPSGSESGRTDSILALPQLSFNTNDGSLTSVTKLRVE